MLSAAHHLTSLHAPTPVAALGGGLMLLACLCEAVAQEYPIRAGYRGGTLLVTRSDEPPGLWSYEVTTVHSRLLASAAPLANLGARTTSDLLGVSYRVWMARGRADVSVGVGTLGYLLPSADARGDDPHALVGSVPTLTLGVRYRMSNEHSVFADASGARGLGADPALAYYATKLGMEWKPAKSRVGLEQGALGFHFDSGYTLSLKARQGGLSVYLRNQF